MKRLAEQRISLANVINMLNEYSSDVDINKNLEKLKQLQPLFDSFVVDVESNFDPATPDGKKTIKEFLSKVRGFNRHIRAIRTEIIA